MDVKDICCCGALFSSVDKGEMTYDPVLKWFACYVKGKEYKKTGRLSEQVIRYCPFCGSKLPNLSFEFEETIEKELGESMVPDGWFPKDRKHLPKEFQTDEWWIKRKL